MAWAESIARARPGGETQGASGERAGSPGRHRALQSRWGRGAHSSFVLEAGLSGCYEHRQVGQKLQSQLPAQSQMWVHHKRLLPFIRCQTKLVVVSGPLTAISPVSAL